MTLNICQDTVGRGLRALVVENDLLSVTLLLDQGGDIFSLAYKPLGLDVLWKVARPVRDPGVGPTPSGDSFEQWLAYYRGGWQTIFPNFGPAVMHDGALLDFHGEAARVPWSLDSSHYDEQHARVTLSVSLAKSPARLERVLVLQGDAALLSISETVTNEGPRPLNCMWGHHPAFGAPFLSPDCVIDTGAQTVEADDDYPVPGNDMPPGGRWAWPLAQDVAGQPVDLSAVPPPGSGHSRVLWLKDFGESWYAITNTRLGVGVGLAWNGDLFPYAALWQETGGELGYPHFGAAYVTAIEPNSSYPAHGLARVMAETGTHLTLAPGESRTLSLQAVFYEGPQRVARIGQDGVVERVQSPSPESS